jgi:hypothetical protein
VPRQWHSGKIILKEKNEIIPRVFGPQHSGKGILKKETSSPNVWFAALWEGYFKKRKILPRVPVERHSGKRFSKKTNFFPDCCTRGSGFKKKKFLSSVLHSWKSFFKKQEMAPTALNHSREGAWHLGNTSPSARDLALGEGCFP